jgi:hypothetical protein
MLEQTPKDISSFNYTQCPSWEQGLGGDYDLEFWCKLTGGSDADFRGWGYDLCKFIGCDYRLCPQFLKASSQKLLEPKK